MTDVADGAATVDVDVERFVDPFGSLPERTREEEHLLIDRLEDAMRRDCDIIDIEPVHYFADGLYAREISIPAGTALTGKIHRSRHINVISHGAILVCSPGEEPVLIRAPYTFVAEAGTRRVGIAIEDTVWTTFHHSFETDLERLESELIEPRVQSISGSASVPPLTASAETGGES